MHCSPGRTGPLAAGSRPTDPLLRSLLGRSRAALARRLTPLLALTVLLGAAGVLALPSATLAWDPNTFSGSSEQALYSLTNQARAGAGLPALRVDSSLASMARYRSQDMEERGYFSHNIPPSGKMAWDVMDERDYCYSIAGENIGWNNYADDEATGQIQQMFMASPGHHDNILGRAWDVMGIGAYKGSDGHMMWTVLFVDRTGCDSAPAATPKPTLTPTPKPTPSPAPAPDPANPGTVLAAVSVTLAGRRAASAQRASRPPAPHRGAGHGGSERQFDWRSIPGRAGRRTFRAAGV